MSGFGNNALLIIRLAITKVIYPASKKSEDGF
jgi:hypothetical protein